MSDASTTSNNSVPAPTEVDESTSVELRVLATSVHLKGSPSGASDCENCVYYLEPTADISYCWHPALRILVGAQWWCECWEATSP